jgi:hypothetical protein
MSRGAGGESPGGKSTPTRAMARNRSVFLNGLKARLDRDMAGREQTDAPPRWSGGPPIAEDDPWAPATDELAAGPDDAVRQEAEAGDGQAGEAEPGPSRALDHPVPAMSWSESGMPERLREAIASVRRISSDGWPDQAWPDEEEPPPEPDDSWEPPEDSWEPPEEEAPPADPVAAAARPRFRAAGFVAASAAVLLVGFGVGALLAGWDLGLPLPATMTASPATGPVARGPEPAAPPEAPPPITEIVRLQPAPLPPAVEAERVAPDQATGGLPLPPPPKPAPWSTVASEGRSAANPVDDPVDAAINALVEEGEAVSSPSGQASGPRVYVHFAARAAGAPAIAMHLVRRLNAEGFAAEARPVDFLIASPSIRYFFAADRDSAEAVSATLEGQIPGKVTPPVVDFTHFEPKPQPGDLEIWVNS